MNIIRRWFDNERKAKAKRNYLRGYDWAAGMLLRGVSSDDVCKILDGETPIEFDNGALAACSRYDALVRLAKS